MFKVSRGLSPEIINELFQFRKQNTLSQTSRQRSQFQIPWVNSVSVVQKALNFLGPRCGH